LNSYGRRDEESGPKELVDANVDRMCELIGQMFDVLDFLHEFRRSVWLGE